MDSDSVKKAIIKQVILEANIQNSRHLVEKINENCFEKCIPKPSSSITSGEKTCVTNCMEKYMAAWNHVNATYMRRVQEEVNKGSFAT
ncbi:mitochondrial import inner membrane translocase subunit TIM13 [Apodospora peruviana]|uniref:Mitochondrial import inner membrane translocase subunit n=1 Tax=Apodospora peruviana TaxID=516989 RepID=A0AAE0M918_9PEZI|nr:mitochondrial import inner membrane translocase subunit TIM13 [Apodospora peruviana]